MTTKHFLTGLCGAAFAAGMMGHVAEAQPDYSGVVQNVFEHPDGADSNPDIPLIYRDDNFSSLFSHNGEEFVFGAIAFHQLRPGSGSIPAIKDIASDSFYRENLDPGDSEAPQIGGLFLARAGEILPVGPQDSGHTLYRYFAPADAGTYSFTDGAGNEVEFDWQPQTEGTLLQLFAQDTGFSYSAGPQAVWDNLINMMKIGEIGFSEEAIAGAQYDLGQQYYAVALSQLADETFVPDDFFGNLDVLSDDANVFPGIRPHDGGQLVHVFGDVSSGQAGGVWGFGGDGGRISFVIPEPGTLGLLAAGGLLLLRRRRTV